MITVFFILMCKKVDKCFDKPRKDVSLHSKLLREHTFILILAMKKNVYFLLALLLIGLSACDNEPKFKVQGEINGAEDKMLYLEASGLDGIVALDSTNWAVAEVLVLRRSVRNLLNSIVCVWIIK